jgi:septal ring factor EnvC (AmiA/AmiB activator)
LIAAASPALAWPCARAAEPEAQLQEIERTLEAGRQRKAEIDREAANLSREISLLQAQSIVAAKAIQDNEERLLGITERLEELNAQAAESRAALARRRAQMARTLAALERVARHPPEALLALPTPPVDAMRGAILLRAALPPLEARVRALGRELAALSELGAKIAKQREELGAAARALTEKRDALEGLMARKRELRDRLREDSEQTARKLDGLAEEARDLRDLLARLEAARARPAPAETPAARAAEPRPPERAALPEGGFPELRSSGPFSEARGSLTMPVRGRLLRLYGEQAAADMPSRGIAIEASGGGQVVAPYDGEVVFAGPFRGYGQLLIIAHGEDYHVLLAGLSRIDVVVGQWLLAGEPVGVMGPSGQPNPQLYIELRHNGEPINPLPWMAARDEKVSG